MSAENENTAYDSALIKLRRLMANKEDPDFFDDPRNIFVGQYNRAVLPLKYCAGSKLQIKISQTATPYRFYFQLDDNKSHITALWQILQSFYNDPAQRNLAMGAKDLKLNRPCIAPYKGLWHRATIISLDQLNKYRVKVFYVDYGTVDYVALDSICFVHENSSKFPTQAFRASVNNLRPIDCDWDFLACKLFNKVTRYHSINATLMAIDTKNKVFYLNIDEISAEMVSAKMAQFSESPVYSPYHGSIYDVPPKFEEVENGIFPTFKERYCTWKMLQKAKSNNHCD